MIKHTILILSLLQDSKYEYYAYIILTNRYRNNYSKHEISNHKYNPKKLNFQNGQTDFLL